jgi:hypothetical protein
MKPLPVPVERAECLALDLSRNTLHPIDYAGYAARTIGHQSARMAHPAIVSSARFWWRPIASRISE